MYMHFKHPLLSFFRESQGCHCFFLLGLRMWWFNLDSWVLVLSVELFNIILNNNNNSVELFNI